MEPKDELLTEYLFTPAEAALIRPALQEAQAKMDTLNALVRLVQSQQNLPTWNLRQDGLALVKPAA